MRSEVYDTLHPLLEQLVDITCNHIEALESENGSFNIDMILEQLEDYGKYRGLLHCEGESFENYIPVSIAKQIVRGRGLGGVLGYMEENQ